MTNTCVCMILNYNDAETVKKLVENIKDYPVFSHILIVDNCSTDDSYQELKVLEKGNIYVIRTDKNGGYGYGNNFGTRYIKEHFKAKYILLSNPDVVFSNELIARFIFSLKKEEKLALVSAIQLDIHGQPIQDLAWKVPTSFEYAILNSGKLSRFFPTNHQLDYTKAEQLVDCVPGALLMYDVDKFLSVGGYDEDMFLFGEETTLGFKLKGSGYSSLLVLDDFYRHEHSVSISKSIQQKSKQLELLYQSRLLFMKRYLKSSKLMLALARFFQNRTLKRLR
ncbi:glycosyltransferase family 2 protein [Streptococcus ruminantium]|uniref:glycosyltransferase family 2 protein n=1 Tax=Streptococcus ruminantium TaxID=1917441 RepID=UPI0012DEF014|nr:glycosyltransferase [Streptococcus ruminantium]